MTEDLVLVELRAAMDALNLHLRDLVQQRASLAAEIARHKRSRGLPVADPNREAQMLDAIAERPGPGLPPDELRRVFAGLFEVSRRHAERAVGER